MDAGLRFNSRPSSPVPRPRLSSSCACALRLRPSSPPIQMEIMKKRSPEAPTCAKEIRSGPLRSVDLDLERRIGYIVESDPHLPSLPAVPQDPLEHANLIRLQKRREIPHMEPENAQRHLL